MTRILLAGVAALALTTGVAFAQTTYSESTTSIQSTVPPAPPSGEAIYKSKKSTTIHRDGTEVEKKQTYSQSSSGGTRATSNSHVVTPNGSEVKTQDEKVVSPTGETTRSSTTTTIDKD